MTKLTQKLSEEKSQNLNVSQPGPATNASLDLLFQNENAGDVVSLEGKYGLIKSEYVF